MSIVIERTLDALEIAVDLVGVTIFLYGFAVGFIGYVQTVFSSGALQSKYERFEAVRCRMGIHLILGLEFLIISDLIASVVSRTLEDLGFLGIIVVIRTVLAYFLDRDMAEVRAELAES